MSQRVGDDLVYLHHLHIPALYQVLDMSVQQVQISSDYFFASFYPLILRMVHSMPAMNNPIYSVRRLSTGLTIAAFNAWKLTVSRAMTMVDSPASANTHQDISVR